MKQSPRESIALVRLSPLGPDVAGGGTITDSGHWIRNGGRGCSEFSLAVKQCSKINRNSSKNIWSV